MFEGIMKFFNKLRKKEEKLASNSKDTAKERLHLVLMQDRANVSADFLELMKQEIIEVIKKYIDIDEGAIDVRLTNKENEDGTNGAPALYANIPILNIKNDARKIEKTKETDNKSEDKKDENQEKENKNNPEQKNENSKEQTSEKHNVEEQETEIENKEISNENVADDVSEKNQEKPKDNGNEEEKINSNDKNTEKKDSNKENKSEKENQNSNKESKNDYKKQKTNEQYKKEYKSKNKKYNK